jgi:hypothetical protein
VSLMHRALYQIHSHPVCFVAAHKGTRSGHRVVRGEATAGHEGYFFGVLSIRSVV